jgi:hypothetical protein
MQVGLFEQTRKKGNPMKEIKSSSKHSSRNMSYSISFVVMILLAAWLYPKFQSKPINSERTTSPQMINNVENSADRSSQTAAPHQPHMVPAQPEPVSPQSSEHATRNQIFSKLESETTLSDVCNSIEKIDRKQNEPLRRDEVFARLEDSVFKRSSDPLIESVKPILKFALRNPALRGFLGIRDDSNPTVALDQSIFEKYKALEQNQKQIEAILDQSYLLLMLGRSVELKPELVSDPEVMNYCRSIEANLNSLNTGNFKEQKKKFNEYLTAIELKPDDIGFYPEYQTDLKIEHDDKSFAYNIGWVKMLWTSN